ncbi:MAG: substrate-binding domain-containing protein [Oscillospiraceae bacterium]|nr:substrate-binding domain-containing protein [Oscillospiraceae bacterium]
MKASTENVIFGIAKAAFLLFAGGYAVLLASVVCYMGLVPLYMAKVFPVVAGGLLLCTALAVSKLVPKKWMKRVWLTMLAISIGCGVYVGFGLYNDSIPVMEDRDSLIYQYEPFAEGTKAVYLNEESTLKFDTPTIDMDGATALYPVYSAFVQAVYPEGKYDIYDFKYNEEDGYGQVTCTGTIEAYQRLIEGKTDIIFCAAPSQDQLDAAAAAGVQLHLTPIGREAFVFFVHSDNPVQGLTVEEIQGIYTGQIKNWRELGGKNQRIRPYQRAENSGSQSALLRLMAGLPLMEPEKEDRIAGMGGIITQVASYRNHKNAVGFSFRFYSTEMVENEQIRLLALNGVLPTKETIRSGEYPISSNFYAVTASPMGQPAPEETNAELRAFLDWILSDQGQEIIEKTGYVGVN